MRIRLPVLFVLASAVAAPSSHAASSFDSCTGEISSLPAVISGQGVWCLKGDLATSMSSGSAITVNTNNVTIDCNGFKLGGLAAGPGSAAKGIRSENRLNTTVRGCNVRGFHTGIQVTGGGGHVVEENRLDGNLWIGLYLWSSATVARRNTVVDTGGSTVDTDAAYGILAYESTDVYDNTVNGVQPFGANGNATGIYADTVEGTISGNRVKGVRPTGTGSGRGIHVGGQQVIVAGNIVQTSGPNDDIGILCADATSSAVRNIVAVFDGGVMGCLDVDNVVN